MQKPKNLTLKHYWECNTSEERIDIVENAFKYIAHLEQPKADSKEGEGDKMFICSFCKSNQTYLAEGGYVRTCLSCNRCERINI